MKKLLLLVFCAIIAVSCSNDDWEAPISSTKLYSKMTKTEAVQVNRIYLFFKLVHF